MTDEQAKEVGDSNWRHSHATHDLYNAIETGEYPEWEFFVQTMDPADEEKFYFDPLDCTKVRKHWRMCISQWYMPAEGYG